MDCAGERGARGLWSGALLLLLSIGLSFGCGADDGLEDRQAESALGAPTVLQAPTPEYNIPVRWCVVGNDVKSERRA